VPVYVKRPIAISGVNYNVAEQQGQLEMMEIVDPIAIKTLERNMPTIIARAAARQALKYQATKQGKQENAALGLLVNIGGALLEQADTRSWTTLPQTIYMARIPLNPGTYNLTLNIVSSYDGKNQALNYDGLEIKAGQNTYRSLHWIPHNVTNLPGNLREYTRVNATYGIR
jgi:hypothetical protein